MAKLKKLFGIDNGELEGMTPQLCFALGYELGIIESLLQTKMPFDHTIHGENIDRVEKSCQTAGVAFDFKWMPGDSSETWVTLRVFGKLPHRRNPG